MVTAEENHRLLANPDFWHPIKSGPTCARWGVPMLARQYELLRELTGKGRAVLIANPGVLAALIVQEVQHIPWVNLILQPWMIPSSIAPSVMPGPSPPRWAPRLCWDVYWRILDSVVHQLVGREFNRVRRLAGLRPLRGIFSHWLSRELVLGMFPDWYGLAPADWPSQVRLVGFPLFEGGQAGPELSADLRAFCTEDIPPVVCTFGTGMMHAGRMFRLVLDACGRRGVRCLFLTGHPAQLPAPLPSFARWCEFAPFRELFPHCSAVIHHGGIGTVAAACSTGTPQLIIPFAYDQMDNASRVQHFGIGEGLANGRVTVETLSGALGRLSQDGVKERCRTVAGRFTGLNSIESAVDCILQNPRIRSFIASSD
jgi:UDP:flavonoid glycosyltransferase YjiC (YdhE family)